ncbi:hypothetical protein ACH4TV_02955 [Streptomyces sp. NPDC020898]|uniref:hypothetical protein n=1 Tax=Streptomyces sp. NPDC020898 TaxID=3365101 RepID=UPI0037956555
MAMLLAVNGVGNFPEFDDSIAARSAWLSALIEGARYAGDRDVSARDLECVSFGDLLARPGPAVGARHVRSFVTRAEVRAEVRARITARIEADTRIVIGHSLGTVAAYEALCLLPEHGVRTLITLGSPLGFRHYIRRRLPTRPVNGRHPWPGVLSRWVNIYDKWDPVVRVKRLSPLFGDGLRIEDIGIDAGPWAHSRRGYLSSELTAQALGEALWDARRTTPARHLDAAQP